jgi:hypothetical protein
MYLDDTCQPICRRPGICEVEVNLTDQAWAALNELSRSSLVSRRQRVESLLRQHTPEAFCFSCLAARLDISATQVRDAAQLLVVDPDLRVGGVPIAVEIAALLPVIQ